MDMPLDKTELLADLGHQYKSFEMLAAQAKVDGNPFDEEMYMGKLQSTANAYGTVAELETYADVHKAILLPN